MIEHPLPRSQNVSKAFDNFLKNSSFHSERVLKQHPESLFAVLDLPYGNIGRGYFTPTPYGDSPFSFYGSLEHSPLSASYRLKQRNENFDPNEVILNHDGIEYFEQKRDKPRNSETMLSHEITASWSREDGELLYVEYMSYIDDSLRTSRVRYKVYYDKPEIEDQWHADQLNLDAAVNGSVFTLAVQTKIGTDQITIPIELPRTTSLMHQVVGEDLMEDFINPGPEADVWRKINPRSLLGIKWQHSVNI